MTRTRLTQVQLDSQAGQRGPTRAKAHRLHDDACLSCGKDRGDRYSGFVSGGSGLPGGGLGM